MDKIWRRIERLSIVYYILALIGILVIIQGVTATLDYFSTKDSEQKRLEQNIGYIQDRLQLNLVSPLWNINKQQARDVLNSEMSNRNLYALEVYEGEIKDDNFFAGLGRDGDWKIRSLEKGIKDNKNLKQITFPIKRNENVVGKVRMYYTMKFLQKKMNSLMYYTALRIALSAFIFGLVIYFYFRILVVRPLKQVQSYVREVGRGNLDTQMGRAQFIGELLELRDHVMDMTAKISSNMQEIEQKKLEADEMANNAEKARNEAEEAQQQAEQARVEGMKQAAARLENIVERVTSTSQEISEQTEESKKGAENQKARASEVSTSMQQMNSSVLEVAQNASSAAENSDSAKEKAEQGYKVVQDVINSISDVSQKTSAMNESLNDLGGQADEIGQVINVINDIADQVNLLALNAAIEAARAGEAGRGFAVVADEVRKLAEKTMSATKDVESSVTNIQNSSKANIEEMKTVESAVENSTSLARQAGDSLEEIVDKVTTSSEQVTQIATASEEQSSASEQINQATEEVNRTASETAESMEQSAQAIEELAQMATELKNLIEELRNVE